MLYKSSLLKAIFSVKVINTSFCVGTFLCGTTKSRTVPLHSFTCIRRFDLAVKNLIRLSKCCQQLFAETSIVQQRTCNDRQRWWCSCSWASMSGSQVHTAWHSWCTVEGKRSSALRRLYIRRTRNSCAARNCHWTCETVGRGHVHHALCCSNERLIIRVRPQIITRHIHQWNAYHWGWIIWCSLFCATHTSQNVYCVNINAFCKCVSRDIFYANITKTSTGNHIWHNLSSYERHSKSKKLRICMEAASSTNNVIIIIIQQAQLKQRNHASDSVSTELLSACTTTLWQVTT